MDLHRSAAETFQRHIAQNPYPGRGLVLGRGDDGALRMLYWIMGRSEHSRNRRFVLEGAALRTEPVDLSKAGDPSLIIYEAMLELPGVHLVSNGDQTRTVCDALVRGDTFEAALSTREREPDAPNFTPRITGMIDLRGPSPAFALSVLRANPFDSALTDRVTHRPAAVAAGFGLCLTTYMGDGNPLPSFSGEPLVVPTGGSLETLLESYWGALDARNRISLAAKEIDPAGRTARVLVENRLA